MWNFEREEQQFEIIPEGAYRIRIKSAEKAVSKTGKDMLALQFDVSGQTRILYHYIVFLPDRPEITNRNLTQFFDSFAGIKEGDFDTSHWVGQVGACRVKHEDYNDSLTERIKYFIPYSKQGELPEWQEAGQKTPAYAGKDVKVVEQADDDDLPF